MSTIFAWKDRFLGVSEDFTANFTDFKAAWEQESDQTSTTDDKKKEVVEKGRKPFQIDMTVEYVYPYCGDPRKCCTAWEPYIGMVDYVYLNDEMGAANDFGPPVQLQKCEWSDIIVDDFGRWLKAKCALKFVEYDETKAAIKYDMTEVNKYRPGSGEHKKEIKRILNTKDQGVYYGDRVTFSVGSTVQMTGRRWASGDEMPANYQGAQGVIEQLDSSGIKMLVRFPDGQKQWCLNMGVSLCA